MKRFKRLLPNAVTLARIACSAVFVYVLCKSLYGHALHMPAVLYGLEAFIWLSDFIDGRLARALRTESAVGARLDILADCSFIFPALMLFNLSGIVPVWFTAVAALDFTGFLLTSRYLQKTPHEPKRLFVFDTLGRLAAMFFYTAPMLACETVGHAAFTGVLYAVLYLAAFLAIVSMTARVRACLILLLRSHIHPDMNRL
ncbi:CDP-alcohol phosphatidyltransferase family protein [Ethanoligenens harbinense]|uniref:CDP-alcohol phosphatidyltransferase n=1 Tax=Ethanoligenens harbinense (strain DSM 18485 / JCM 12961 / CGMCC 1.5033 / YUAN-3) TaxID=663278 RepID=E6U671_ETHHY|nr:CDP-alcohol phosphatidyltransferase family protein [Ethanoligenens harbinense]ADU26838.1 CDP-alcohol phosphatidyltransferase [Ethanoligenens harbinense YUAN-3]AVQ95944.1 hypothetical protein CXQ68_06685 [Ethanoligenens harbinense YUAN-3]AYF38606.1 hypothetical protein CXP51_06555 [Ethanoligenens harbinense]AYF41352.1 hypothetical protein CN246_06690 [Ethanoligenens harbinense]QCN92185.1 CDP-alcohol phosphatidyltransferase family protein [Ethanoligenens harbinense]